ncbi:MAG: indole-3-glycerol phosphate synthase TrpC [Marinifilaceae bacterium]
MKDVLQQIIADKREEIAYLKKHQTAQQRGPYMDRSPRSMKQSVLNTPGGIIAEFKRRSPSRGWINQEAEAGAIVPAYAAAGAAAISILTDNAYFSGCAQDMLTVRPLVDTPLLRKEFIIDSYQITEARALGADAILLIAAALSKQQCDEFTDMAHSIGLEVLLEIHSEEELHYITPKTDMVGVNNRNLGSFITDVNNSFQIAKQLPQGMVKISESGISNTDTVHKLKTHGFSGFLIGDCFMSNPNPAQELLHFIDQLNLLTC